MSSPNLTPVATPVKSAGVEFSKPDSCGYPGKIWGVEFSKPDSIGYPGEIFRVEYSDF